MPGIYIFHPQSNASAQGEQEIYALPRQKPADIYEK